MSLYLLNRASLRCQGLMATAAALLRSLAAPFRDEELALGGRRWICCAAVKESDALTADARVDKPFAVATTASKWEYPIWRTKCWTLVSLAAPLFDDVVAERSVMSATSCLYCVKMPSARAMHTGSLRRRNSTPPFAGGSGGVSIAALCCDARRCWELDR